MYEEIIKKMSLEDKIAFCSGKDFWSTKSFKKYNIPSIMMCDGPHGLRKQNAEVDMLGVYESIKATCFPTAVTSGATWNKELLIEMGKAIATEAAHEEVAVMLGPGVNIKRNPLCGRNFEYFSEDPFLAGKLGASYVNGLQENGIQASLKHFAANSQEYKRFSSDSQIDERTLREIYLSAFEIVVKESKPATVMCAYNKINNVYCSDNKKLLTDILRNEWGFDGMVVTDWGAMADRIKGFEAGCDLSMPGGSAYQEKETYFAVKNGKLSENYINKSVERILKVVANGRKAIKKKNDNIFDLDKHSQLAKKIATEGIVLLKNEEDILPIKENQKITLIGNMAKNIRYQGNGSSHIIPTKLSQIIDIMDDVNYIEGCDDRGEISFENLNEVKKAAKESDVAVVFVGLTEEYESEGFDRDNLELPTGHNKMVEASLSGNPNTIVVLMGGSVMKLPWVNKVKAIVYMGLCGQSGAEAIKDILTGIVSPSGKLTETWPYNEIDVPSYGIYAGKNKDAQYREGIYVGYRYYEKANIEPLFPFGYGLSYTKFEYTNIEIEGDKVKATIKNIGNVDGSEVVQLYVKFENCETGIFRPIKELKGFEKVFLKVNESKVVEFELNDRSFAIYQNGWKIPTGTYTICLGASSKDIRLQTNIYKEGENIQVPSWQKDSWYNNPIGYPTKEDWSDIMRNLPKEKELKKGNFNMDNTLVEMKDYSFMAKLMCISIENQ